MAIVQVKDAEGSVLDWMVAKCEVTRSVRMFENSKGFRVYKNERMKMQGINFAPSTVWAQGGPIIDRQDIQWCKLNGQIEAWSGFDYIDWRIDWDSEARMPEGSGFGIGPSILIAAMRCYVSSVLGDEVEVPDELI